MWLLKDLTIQSQMHTYNECKNSIEIRTHCVEDK